MAMEIQTQPQSPQNVNNSTVWSDRETDAFMKFLCKEKAKMGDAGMFKKPTFNEAASHIETYHSDSVGLPKTGKSCKTKYTSVRNIYSTFLVRH